MLDFSQVTTQIKSFAIEQLRTLPQFKAALAEAGRRWRDSGHDWEQTREKIANSRTSWLLAEWREPPDQHISPSQRPIPSIVLASDGSQIVTDRHDIAQCYLLNVGFIALRYGTGERAILTSRPILELPDEDLLEEFQGEQTAIVPKRLAIKRLLAEFAGLAEMITEHASRQTPMIALSDGSLILWPLETEKESFRAQALQEFQRHLETARRSRVPIIGYISRPASRDVVNALRIQSCPHPRADCDRFCPHRNAPKPLFMAPDCTGTERITDADLFAQILKPGERSSVFGSRSKILQQYQEEHRVRFFYLHTGQEVARVEVPNWVAEESALLRITHSLCYDQAQKGEGYPVALAEAHEQAIVRSAERTAFFHLMEREFVTTGIPAMSTQKAVSKHARRV
jgi:hypothetical protein